MPAASALDWRVTRALALGFLALKLTLLVAARPFMDEMCKLQPLHTANDRAIVVKILIARTYAMDDTY